jgi:hypothetical protein
MALGGHIELNRRAQRLDFAPVAAALTRSKQR